MIATRNELPTRLLSRFHGKLSAFFAVQAGADSFARRPRLGLTLVVPGDPEASLEIRPGWCRWRKKLDSGTLAIDLLVNRTVRGDHLQRTSYRPLELGLTLTPDDPRINRRSLRYGDEGQGRIAEVVADFLADPMASLSRSKDRCCLCRPRLTDGTSVLQGYGPECSKKIGTLLDVFSGDADCGRYAEAPNWDFDSTLPHPVEPDDDDFGIELDGQVEAGLVPHTGIGGESDASLEGLDHGPEPEQPDPLDRYFDPEAGIWWVESHHGQVCVGLPWTDEAPLEVVLEDAANTISGCIEDGITDEDDNPITDYRSFVLWKGPDVAAVATEPPTDPSRLEFTCFRA